MPTHLRKSELQLRIEQVKNFLTAVAGSTILAAILIIGTACYLP